MPSKTGKRKPNRKKIEARHTSYSVLYRLNSLSVSLLIPHIVGQVASLKYSITKFSSDIISFTRELPDVAQGLVIQRGTAL